MAEVLTFGEAKARRFGAGQARPMTFAGHIGALQGAVSEADRQDNIRNAAMRNVKRQSCKSCGQTWIAPACGACPACHSLETALLEENRCDLARV